jgi:eukaryotic-like serine/threonine-protein kinase
MAAESLWKQAISKNISAMLSSLDSEQQPKDVEQFARLLVKQKMITPYQAKQVYSGKGKSLLLGNYLVLDKLGQGGMGMVLKAEHRRMKRIVALKVLAPTVSKSPDVARRFQREVEAAAKLEHPNIVTAHDADEANGTHFLVMQYVEGKDLAEVIKDKGPVSVATATN